jgi:ADP-heptose:LPS heptosyltransferase
VGSKVWPVYRYKELINNIKDVAPIKVIGTTADEVVLNEFRDLPCEVILSESIGYTLGLIAESMLVIANCSSILHLSDLVSESKILAIYGPTHPYITGPNYSNMVIVRKNYKCAPCFADDFNSGCGNNRCITDISVEDVENGFYRALHSDFDIKEDFSSLKTSYLRRYVE